MKIDNATAVPPLNRAEKPRSPGAETEQTGRQKEAAYVVTISDAGQEAAEARDDELRRAKVAAIREQLASGSYNISGKDVAGKILGALKG